MIDWSLLQQVTSESVHFIDAAEEKTLRQHAPKQLKVFELNDVAGKPEVLFRHLAESLNFPDYAGANWDAVEECLTDMETSGKSGAVLFVRGAESLWKSHAKFAAALIETWMAAAEQWRAARFAFHLVFVW